MKLKLVKASHQYRDQITDMLDEWNATGEKIIPYAIRRLDYHDFAYYCENLEVKDTSSGLIPDSTFFCQDEERNRIVGAVNIRHYLNDNLLIALLKATKKMLDGNFIEGMACVGGCIGGAGCLTHGEINKIKIDKHGRLATHNQISHAVDALNKKS